MEERLEFAPLPALETGEARWPGTARSTRRVHCHRWAVLPRLHGIEPHEVDVTLPLAERVGHSLVLGTTRVGKTRLAELFIMQDIRRKVNAASTRSSSSSTPKATPTS
jgi:hypothetical protein